MRWNCKTDVIAILISLFGFSVLSLAATIIVLTVIKLETNRLWLIAFILILIILVCSLFYLLRYKCSKKIQK